MPQLSPQSRALAGLALALVLAAPAARAQNPAPAWTGGAQTINPTPTNDTGAISSSLALDAAGNQYVGGSLQSGAGSGQPATRAFGSTSLSSTGAYGSGFVAKLSPSQQWLWAVAANTTGESSSIRRVAVGPAGDVYAAGIASIDPFGAPGGATLSIGGQSATYTADFSFFVARLDGSGQGQWVRAFSGSVIPMFLKWDAVAGNLVMAGQFYGNPTFGTTTLSGGTQSSLFVARLSAAGQWLSAVAVSSSAGVVPVGGDVGPQGQVAITGSISSGAAVSFGSTTVPAPANGNCAFVAQLSPAGTWDWVATSSAPASPTGYRPTQGSSVAYLPSGDLWAVGNAAPGTTVGTTTVGSSFAAPLSRSGQWGAATTVADAAFYYVAADPSGDALVLASLGNGPTFNGGTYAFGPHSVSVGQSKRTAVARLGAGGTWRYALASPASGPTVTTASDYNLNAPALDAAGNLYTVGSFRGGPLVLGATTLTGSQYNATSFVGGDVLVAKLANAGTALAARQPAGLASLLPYPNPVATGANFSVTLPAGPAPAALVLRDALGRVAAAVPVPAGRTAVVVPTAGLAPGLYLLEAGARRAQVVVQ